MRVGMLQGGGGCAAAAAAAPPRPTTTTTAAAHRTEAPKAHWWLADSGWLGARAAQPKPLAGGGIWWMESLFTEKEKKGKKEKKVAWIFG